MTIFGRYSVTPVRDLNRDLPAAAEAGTQFEECDEADAEMWSVHYNTGPCGSDLIDDWPTRAEAEAWARKADADDTDGEQLSLASEA